MYTLYNNVQPWKLMDVVYIFLKEILSPSFLKMRITKIRPRLL